MATLRITLKSPLERLKIPTSGPATDQLKQNLYLGGIRVMVRFENHCPESFQRGKIVHSKESGTRYPNFSTPEL